MPAKREPDRLRTYRAKRDFTRTPEPADSGAVGPERAFVVQKHAARRLHYDLRLQFGDTLRSWAVPQGPSLDPKVRRLAVRVEDHPLAYLEFEATIPEGQYGAGAMIVWDRGSWVPMGDAEADYDKGTIKFRLAGEKLGGGWMLVRIKGDGEDGKNWLLIKERDPFARPEVEGDILEERPESILSGRRVEELAAPAPRTRAKPRPVDPARLEGARPGALPDTVRPQLATPAAEVPEGDDWLHEIKFDGYRTIVRLEDGAVRLLTRSGHDWTERYGMLARPFARLRCRQALLDGEIVVQDATGLSSFSDLQDALAEGRTEALTFFAFDLLHLDGQNLGQVTLADRKRVLERLFVPVLDQRSALQLSEHVRGDGPAFFEQASRLGLEGVIAKRADSPYQQGRSRSWLKCKCRQTDDFVIVGFTESQAAGGLAALLVAEAGPQGIRYVGRVGTGFSTAEAERLRSRLGAMERDGAAVELPATERRKDIRWVDPLLLAEVHYATRTADGLLRHAVYQGLRLDQPPPMPVASSPSNPRRRWISDADLASIWVTNPDRRMFGGPSKLELALYYARVGDWLLPELVKRPVSLVRCPSGKVEDCFFQRHALSGMPEAIEQVALREEGSKERADYLYLDDAKGLLSLVQFGAVELHAWGCRVDKPERPDRLVFDLDPDEGLPWPMVVDAAREVRDALERLGLVAFVKTTGGKGLHVVVPIVRRHAWAQVRQFCEAFARSLAKQAPRRFTANMAKRERRGRIFIDYLRNLRGATAVAAYSLRARAGVAVSTPLAWQELDDIDDPSDLDYATVPEWLASDRADPWQGIDAGAGRLNRDMVLRLQR
jgi:bifunctional non-homologous end joining protein LigD